MADTTSTEARPSPAGAAPLGVSLLRDPIVRATLAVWVLALVPYVLPIQPGTLENYSSLYVPPLMLAMIVVAAFQGVRRIASAVERQFWLLIGLAFGVWLLSCLPWILTAGADSPRLTFLTDLAYTAFYLLLLMGITLRPHLGSAQPMLATARRFRVLGVFVLVLAGLTYFLLVPLALAPAVYNTWLPSFYLYLVFDVLVLARLLLLRREASAPRWRALYGLLAVAALGLLYNDAVEYFFWAEWVTYPYGTVLDASWTLAPVLMVVAIRARHFAAPMPADAPPEASPGASLLRTPVFLVAAALAMPVIHLALDATTLVDPSLHRPREYVAIAALVALAALAGLALRALKRERALLG